MIIKVAVNATARRDILDIARIMGAQPVDVSDHTVTLQVIVIEWSLFGCTISHNFISFQKYGDRLKRMLVYALETSTKFPYTWSHKNGLIMRKLLILMDLFSYRRCVSIVEDLNFELHELWLISPLFFTDARN
jgi:hypothetical protein